MADRSEWARRVSEWRRSGLTAAEFCRGRDFAVSTLRWYSSQLGEIEEVDDTPEPAFAKIELRRERSARPPEVERTRVAVADGFLACAGDVNRFERQRDFDQLFAHRRVALQIVPIR